MYQIHLGSIIIKKNDLICIFWVRLRYAFKTLHLTIWEAHPSEEIFAWRNYLVSETLKKLSYLYWSVSRENFIKHKLYITEERDVKIKFD